MTHFISYHISSNNSINGHKKYKNSEDTEIQTPSISRRRHCNGIGINVSSSNNKQGHRSCSAWSLFLQKTDNFYQMMDDENHNQVGSSDSLDNTYVDEGVGTSMNSPVPSQSIFYSNGSPVLDGRVCDCFWRD